jgi:hypothetical protein
MKRVTVFLFSSIIFLTAIAQTKDPALDKRLKEYMALSKKLDFEKLMDYMHPKIFKVVPKEQLVELFRSSFENGMMTIEMDSLSVLKASSPYTYQGSVYRRIDYFLSMNLKLNDSSFLKTDSTREAFIDQMKAGFPGAAVSYVNKENYLNIDTKKIMFAIKDPNLKWMFIGYENNQGQMMEMLIPKQVLTYFKL